jgi:hypothetical protein
MGRGMGRPLPVEAKQKTRELVGGSRRIDTNRDKREFGWSLELDDALELTALAAGLEIFARPGDECVRVGAVGIHDNDAGAEAAKASVLSVEAAGAGIAGDGDLGAVG